jgi:hypothetical protein
VGKDRAYFTIRTHLRERRFVPEQEAPFSCDSVAEAATQRLATGCDDLDDRVVRDVATGRPDFFDCRAWDRGDHDFVFEDSHMMIIEGRRPESWRISDVAV